MLAVFMLLSGNCPERTVIAKTTETPGEAPRYAIGETAEELARQSRPAFGPAAPFPQWMA